MENLRAIFMLGKWLAAAYWCFRRSSASGQCGATAAGTAPSAERTGVCLRRVVKNQYGTWKIAPFLPECLTFDFLWATV